MTLIALAETNAVVTTTNVLLHLKQINQHEGIYSVHVWKILETTNGVPELITQTHSDDPDVARLASNWLWQISEPMWEESHSKTNDWKKWWQETGSTKPFKDLYRGASGFSVGFFIEWDRGRVHRGGRTRRV